MTEPVGTGGQVASDSSGTTDNTPAQTNGVSGSTAQTTGNGPVASVEESFFDPASIQDKPELLAAYKQMQGSYTKAMQKSKEHLPMVDAYRQFQADPVGTMQRLAQQYGQRVIPIGEEQPKDFNPTSWDDVKQHFFNEFKKEMAPVFNEVRDLKKQNVETYLDGHFPDWREYEGQMMETLQANPTLVKDPEKLYRASVPEHVLEARYTAKAMQKIKATSANAQVSGGTTTTRPTQQVPAGPLSFNQAVEAAKAKLAQRGIAG